MKAEPLSRRVDIDTNVWLSAALSANGATARVVRRVLAYGMPVFSEATFAELDTRIIHAHPTLGEAVQEAALRALGHALHI